MKHKEKIIKLYNEGKSYKDIVKILGCSISTVSYHCGEGQKVKNKNRGDKNKKNEHPYYRKIACFKERQYNNIDNKPIISTIQVRLRHKLYRYHKNKEGVIMELNFTVQDVIDKFGINPRCNLTGELIDIYKPSTYEFDHIIPKSRGGDNSLNNLAICTKLANQAKRNLTDAEFVELCKKVVAHAGSAPAYTV
jgi:transposase